MKRVRVWIYKNQVIFLSLLLFAFLFYISYFLYSGNTLLIERVLRDVTVSIQNIITPHYDIDYQNVVESFEQEKEMELNSLRKLLDLSNNSSFYLEHASIVSRNTSLYFDVITIDKGKSRGLDKDMLVVTEQGLVGRVQSVSKNSAVIQLITTKDKSFKIAVSVVSGNNTYNGILSGYDEVEEEIIVSSIRSQSEIELGSQVITNGLGNLYPKGIVIGEVSQIEMDEKGISKVLKIHSNVDFRNLKYVSVVKGVQS